MLTHLLELRRRTLYVLIWFLILFLLLFYKAGSLYSAIVSPLLKILPQQEGLIATQITSPIFTPLKLAADAAMLLSAPFALYQLWCFISPGLYQKEQIRLRGAMGISLLLFLSGLLFCFYLVLPFMFQFFSNALPAGVRLMPDMSYTVDFITHMLLIFGFCFQVPLICLLLARMQLIDVGTLKKIRPYIIVAAFIIGMLLTPPDVLSQVMVAVPLCVLYELGILLAILC